MWAHYAPRIPRHPQLSWSESNNRHSFPITFSTFSFTRARMERYSLFLDIITVFSDSTFFGHGLSSYASEASVRNSTAQRDSSFTTLLPYC